MGISGSIGEEMKKNIWDCKSFTYKTFTVFFFLQKFNSFDVRYKKKIEKMGKKQKI